MVVSFLPARAMGGCERCQAASVAHRFRKVRTMKTTNWKPTIETLEARSMLSASPLGDLTALTPEPANGSSSYRGTTYVGTTATDNPATTIPQAGENMDFNAGEGDDDVLELHVRLPPPRYSS